MRKIFTFIAVILISSQILVSCEKYQQNYSRQKINLDTGTFNNKYNPVKEEEEEQSAKTSSDSVNKEIANQ